MKAQSNKIFGTSSFFLVFCFCSLLNAQTSKIAIGFYNLENLFDTLDDSLTVDEEFTPGGSKVWTEKLYKDKLERLSHVIHQMGVEDKSAALAVLGVCEIENRRVLEDLVNSEQIKNQYLKIVHHNSPDVRGVDVALLYQPKLFTVLKSQAIKVSLFENDSTPKLTRDVLLVKGILGRQIVYILVNHWPSRRGGEASKPYRLIAANTVKQVTDSISRSDPDASIIIMGDFNDNPDDESLNTVLQAQSKLNNLKDGEFFNPFYKNYKGGEGSTSFDDAWNLFDQILLSKNLVTKFKSSSMKYQSHKVFKKSFMIEKYGHFKNNPKRTFSGDRYNYGYSDHFPVICYFEINN